MTNAKKFEQYINQQDNHQDFKLKQNKIIHTEEVIIGTEQGTTFPTKIGTSVCNALIDTGATKSCISEKFYQQLPTINMQKLKNVSVVHNNLIICRNLT